MPEHVRAISPRALTGMLASVLLVGATSAPAPASPVPQQPAALSAGTVSWVLYIYFSDATYTTEVGTASVDCDGVYTLYEGYATPYYRRRDLVCPT